MFKRTISSLIGLFLTVGLLGWFAPTANADGIESGTKVSYSSASAEDKTTVEAVATADVKGKTNLEYIVKNGVTYKGKCPTVSKVTDKLLKSKKCFVLKKGKKFVNSGRNRAGKVVYYTDTTKSNTKFIKVSGQWRKANCGNYARFKKYPALKASQVHLVKSFAEVTVALKVTATATATAKAEAWCKSDSSSASASASGSGTATVTITVTGKAKAEAEAKAKATSAAQKIVTSLRTQASVEAKAKAEAEAKASATAKAVCTETKPTPPPTPSPKLIETETINDVILNNTRTIQVSGTVAPGKSATLFASAKNGGSITANKSQTVSGGFTVKVTYKAPDEVPSSGTDWVEFTLTQDDGQSVSASTNKLVIRKLVDDPE